MSMAEIVKLAVVLEITWVQEITEKIRSVSKVYEWKARERVVEMWFFASIIRIISYD